jgi:hypothetical protein
LSCIFSSVRGGSGLHRRRSRPGEPPLRHHER